MTRRSAHPAADGTGGGAQPWHGIWGNPPAPWPMLTEVLMASGAGGTRSPHVPAVCGAWQAMKAQLCSSRALLWLQPRLGLFTSEQGAQADAEAGDTPKTGLKQLGACQSHVPSTGAAQSSGHVVLTQKPQRPRASPASSCPQRLQPASLQGSTGGSAAKQPQNVPPMWDDPTPTWDNPSKGHNNRLIERRLEKPPGQCRD